MPVSPLRLSVVIVAFEMATQIGRTLRSLSPAMQSGILGEEYELIVVDNGSSPPLQPELYETRGAQLRWLRIDDASPSPATAANQGIAKAQAPLVGAMIDGARMVSPGLLRHALLAARLHSRPVIATFGFHLGRERQQEAVRRGFDAGAEEKLLSDARWTEDGYRLFDVSVPAGSSNAKLFAAPGESNALFMPRELWHELGGFDEQFRAPGGGLVNPDLFVRACALPGSQLIMLLGEGTFHQLHGGATTDHPDPRHLLEAFHDEYIELRGHEFKRPEVKPLFAGRPSSHAVAALRREG